LSHRLFEDFEVVETADGSPSLVIANDAGRSEKMHHTAGALAESIYIYHSAVVDTLDRGWPLRALSLGLGLGYNELLLAAEAVKRQLRPDSVAIFSFESEPFLIASLRAWVLADSSPFANLYEKILALTAKQLQVNGSAVKNWLKQSLDERLWQLRNSYPDDAANVTNVTCVFYDAFSNKMSPELWDENILTAMLDRICAANCVFSTYAVTGNLKRALKRSGFVLSDRVGYAGKRGSTYAIRSEQARIRG
jgi:tRNA U34 5-methylaminomethyl-2-thiouridine-forming methyltransferase MnmC